MVQVEAETELRLQHESFEAAFDTFLTEQQELKAAGFFEPFLVDKRKQLRSAIKGSDWFGELYTEATRLYRDPLSDDKFSWMQDHFIGAIWENTAYHFLAAQQPDDRVVLSPKQTFELFCWTLKERGKKYQIVQNPFGSIGIKRYGLPDGVVYDLKNQSNLFICEFTCHKDQQYFDKKFNNFILGKSYQRKLYADAQLLFVIPKNMYHKLEFNTIPIPITHAQFGEFMTGVIGKYRILDEEDTPRATLLELQESAREYSRQAEVTADPRKLLEIDVGSVEG